MTLLYKHSETGEQWRGCHLCPATLPDTYDNFHNRLGERTALCCTGCCHTLPPLQRDVPNPMAETASKPCRRCGRELPNGFDHFPAKLWRSRDELTTADVCLECRREKLSATLRLKAEFPLF